MFSTGCKMDKRRIVFTFQCVQGRHSIIFCCKPITSTRTCMAARCGCARSHLLVRRGVCRGLKADAPNTNHGSNSSEYRHRKVCLAHIHLYPCYRARLNMLQASAIECYFNRTEKRPCQRATQLSSPPEKDEYRIDSISSVWSGQIFIQVTCR